MGHSVDLGPNGVPADLADFNAGPGLARREAVSGRGNGLDRFPIDARRLVSDHATVTSREEVEMRGLC